MAVNTTNGVSEIYAFNGTLITGKIQVSYLLPLTFCYSIAQALPSAKEV